MMNFLSTFCGAFDRVCNSNWAGGNFRKGHGYLVTQDNEGQVLLVVLMGSRTASSSAHLERGVLRALVAGS
jgi:hypothetical protein